ncbi:MAG TPA: dipicolinate synthase subunit B [Clostridia bacterium]|nr:dipicolinate synthase subunit B [Clostridia bacterium]
MRKIGLAVSGSFCTFANLLTAIDDLIANDFDITPVFSFNVATFDTRFFKAKDFRQIIEEKTGKKVIDTIVEAEPVAQMNLELLLIAPCTGNTLAKIAHGITDTPVTMASKAQLRNNRPIVLSVSSNDALGANAKNLGTLLNNKNIYFVPLGQDAPTKKANSLIANTSLITTTCIEALSGRQLQPIIF